MMIKRTTTQRAVDSLMAFAFCAVICSSLHADDTLPQSIIPQNDTGPYCAKVNILPSNELREMLHREASTLSTAVIDKVMSVLTCVNKYHIEHNNILTIVDYSLPANQKRLWVFDLQDNKLLFNTYVSHGIKSGALLSTLFSNKYDSKTSSIGVYKTEQIYYGRDGLSLRLTGLDNGFNSNASNRYIVMHGGWYVEEKFIQKYGRSGRSWGCPAVPLELAKPIINTIKDHSLLIAYYPSDDWFAKSRFLKCDNLSPIQPEHLQAVVTPPVENVNEKRDEILLTAIHNNSKSEENTAVLVISADQYKRTFNAVPPLARMLRRQINDSEYIALSTGELERMLSNKNTTATVFNTFSDLCFVKPAIKMVRGYYETQMQLLNFGKIIDIAANASPGEGYTVRFETKHSIHLQKTDRFIRWLGL